METMFCYQCEQTANCSGCTGNRGVCGKTADVANLQDALTGALIGLARATDGNEKVTKDTWHLMASALLQRSRTSISAPRTSSASRMMFTQKPPASSRIAAAIKAPAATMPSLLAQKLWTAQGGGSEASGPSILFGIRGMAAYAHPRSCSATRG